MTTIIDTAGGFPSPAALKAAGHSGLLAYVSPSRPGTNFAGKPITRDVLAGYFSAGVPVAPVWQYGKPGDKTPSDWTTGREGGRRMARQALDAWFAAGGPGWTPIYFAVDEDITLDQWNRYAVNFFRGAGEVLGTQWVGIYGHARVCAWAAEDGVIGRTPDGSKWWAWQTRAWSGTEIAPEAVLYQRVIDTAASPGPRVDGIVVDVNDVLAPDWGQTGIDRSKTPEPAAPPSTSGGAVVAPAFENISMIGGASSPRSKPVINFLLHTEQGGGQTPGTDAVRLARYCNNVGNGVSYHYSLRAGKLVQLVPLDRASWSVLDANAYTVNLCFAGSYAEWSRQQWLDNCRDDIRIAAFVAVRDCKALGIPVDVIAPPYKRGSGISDHKYVTQMLGIGTHTDVGGQFPWDVFAADVASFLVPPVNLIDEAAKRAAGWIGKRLAADGAAGESIIRADGRESGRFVAYENGHVYWKVGAAAAYVVPHADPQIPGTGLFETWGADYGYETGTGYPVAGHVVVTNGASQQFEDGILFRKNGELRGWRVHGRILDAYKAYGFEQGPLGWPTGDEVAVDGTDNIGQAFEHGSLVWSPTGVTILIDKKVAA